MGVVFFEAPEAEEIGKALVRLHHPHLEHATIRYIFRSTHLESGGKQTFATVTACRGRLQYFAKCDFLVEIAQDIWDTLNDFQRAAVIDHELCHCQIGRKGWECVGHDVEEFEAIIDRYGGFTDCRQSFMLAVEKRLWREAHGQT